MPPPSPPEPLPPLIVRLEMATVFSELMLNTRLALFALTIIESVVGPTIFRSCAMGNWPRVNKIVDDPMANLMSILFVQLISALASWIAARSVQTPPLVAQAPSPGAASSRSDLLFTVNAVG